VPRILQSFVQLVLTGRSKRLRKKKKKEEKKGRRGKKRVCRLSHSIWITSLYAETEEGGKKRGGRGGRGGVMGGDRAGHSSSALNRTPCGLPGHGRQKGKKKKKKGGKEG